MEIREILEKSASNFTLPAYEEIPDVGLFLEQVVRYAAKYTEAAGLTPLTASMVSNYVKKKIISNPVKKMYSRDQIACLLFIAVAKNVVPIEDMQFLLAEQQKNCTTEEAYEFFRVQMQDSLQCVCGTADGETMPSRAGFDWRSVLRTICLAAAHGIYLDRCIEALKTSKPLKEEQT